VVKSQCGGHGRKGCVGRKEEVDEGRREGLLLSLSRGPVSLTVDPQRIQCLAVEKSPDLRHNQG
jgi:hypothetical protein